MPAKAKHRRAKRVEGGVQSKVADKGGSVGDGDIKIPELRPVPASIAKPDDHLCDTCKKLRLVPSRFVVPQGMKAPIDPDDPDAPRLNLGFVEDVKKRSNCPLCRLVLTALGPKVPSLNDGRRVVVMIRWDSDGPVPAGKEYYDHIPEIRLLRPYLLKEGTYDYIKAERDALNHSPEITILANDAPTPSKAFFPRLIHHQIDFDMVRQWLVMCETWHGDECNKSRLFDSQKDPTVDIPHFRLIDVTDNCIVPAPKGSKYIALSYVWGRIDPETILRALKHNIAELEKPGSLNLPENNNRIPLTIRDAMDVVAKLNFRYLWVDSLCIVQDDDGPNGSKMGAITNMNIVYGGAHLTIMALTGNDANAGLPGLRPDLRRNSQAVEEIFPGFHLAVRPSWLDPFPDATVYYSRGWTFQEQQLCIRSIMFIGGQVVYSCKGTEQWREDVVCEDRRTQMWGSLYSKQFLEEISPFMGLLSSYSARSLTFDTDIYHAFAGMTYGFNSELGTNLCHGIPGAYFDWFLLWTTSYHQKRRTIAPSWSWSGWIGTSKWDTSTGNVNIYKIRKILRSRTWIIWYQRKAHDSEDYIRVWTPTNPPPISPPGNFYGGTLQNRFSFDCSRTLPTPRMLTGAPKYVEDTHNPFPGSGFLQFWTVSVMFKLDKPKRKENGWPGLIPNVNTRVRIFGRHGREVGTVFVSPDWAETNVPNYHEFILLCEGRDEGEDEDVKDEREWNFKMMLIEWHGDWAERVSVCSLNKLQLKDALGKGPIWKEIILA